MKINCPRVTNYTGRSFILSEVGMGESTLVQTDMDQVQPSIIRIPKNITG